MLLSSLSQVSLCPSDSTVARIGTIATPSWFMKTDGESIFSLLTEILMIESSSC